MTNLVYLLCGLLIARVFGEFQSGITVVCKPCEPVPAPPKPSAPMTVASLRQNGYEVKAVRYPAGNIRLSMKPLTPTNTGPKAKKARADG